jgi:hypothetical protein
MADPPKPPPPKDDKSARLAAALKANLKRRKSAKPQDESAD